MMDTNTKFVKFDVGPKNIGFGVGCLICGETVPLTDNEVEMLRHNMHIHSKVCDKCKQAVLHIRKQLERDPCEPILD